MTGRRMPGVAIGIVQELDEAQGRLRVDLPWLDDEQRSAWAPVAAAMSGNQRGAFFMPEVGDEVLLGFEHGDFDHPFVLGFLWNGVDRAPESDKDYRVIVTPGGHTLRFEDKAGAKKIVLKTAGDRSITLDDAPGAGKVAIKSGSHEILMDDTPGVGKVRITAGASVTLTLDATGVTLNVAVGAINVNAAAGAVNLTCGTATVTSTGPVSLTAPALTVNAPVTTFTGIVTAGVLQAPSVIAQVYTPGIGNLI